MVLSRTLGRSLRAREDDSDSEPYSDELAGSSPSVLDTGDGGNIASSDAESASDQDEFMGGADDYGDANDGDDVQEQLSKVSFGALAKAQDTLAKQNASSRKRKRGSENNADQEDKLQALRERLRELKTAKAKEGGAKKFTKKTRVQESDEEDASNSDSGDSDSDEEESGKKSKSRSSKHAPAVMSSRKPVSRKREVLAPKKRVARDPRFDALSGPLDTNKLKHNYAFLDQYRDSEMAELKATIKKTKNEEDKEILKKKLLSMESQKKAKELKERREKVVREHKKQEKEAIKEGKKPFYLKKNEVKKLALVDQFSNMKGKQRDKLMERRRKKATAKERKNMPAARRAAGE